MTPLIDMIPESKWTVNMLGPLVVEFVGPRRQWRRTTNRVVSGGRPIEELVEGTPTVKVVLGERFDRELGPVRSALCGVAMGQCIRDIVDVTVVSEKPLYPWTSEECFEQGYLCKIA